MRYWKAVITWLASRFDLLFISMFIYGMRFEICVVNSKLPLLNFADAAAICSARHSNIG